MATTYYQIPGGNGSDSTLHDIIYNDDISANVTDLIFNNFSTTEMIETIIAQNKTLHKYNPTLRLYDILIPSIGAIAIILNLAVVVSSGLILKKGQQPRCTYLFLGNVAMTDLVTALSVVFGQLYPFKYRDHYICSIQIGMIVSSTLASVFSVGLIAMDRYLYILHGLQYQRWIYPTRARVSIALTWIIGCLIGFMPLFGWHGDTQNGRKCWFILLAPKDLIVVTVAFGAIPLITVVVLYTIILYHAMKNIYKIQRAQQAQDENRTTENPNGLRMFRGKSSDSDKEGDAVQTDPAPMTTNLFKRMFMRRPTSKVHAPNKWKAIKVVFFTSGSFVVTWGPYFVVSLIYVYTKDEERLKRLSILIASPLAILGFANSLINPIIYAWWHKGFRSFVKRALDSARKKRGNANASNSQTPSSKNTTSTGQGRKTTSSSGTGSTAGVEIISIQPIKEL